MAKEDILLKSSDPIPDKRPGWVVSMIQICVPSFIGGIIILFAVSNPPHFFSNLVAIAIIGGMIGSVLSIMKSKDFAEKQLDELRELKFKFVYNVTADELYSKLQPALTEKYGNKFEFNRQDDVISVICGRTIYNIILNDDATFRIWWRKNFKNAVRKQVLEFLGDELSDIELCREVRTQTAIIAYELQQQFDVK